MGRTASTYVLGWEGPESAICSFIESAAQECFDVYARSPIRVREDVGNEKAISEGGYGHRQVYELIQNAADAILQGLNEGIKGSRIDVVLTDKALYCANEGSPIDEHGVKSILHAHISSKRGDEIGHFGLGFKSVLAISKTPQFFSRSGSFGFDAVESRNASAKLPQARTRRQACGSPLRSIRTPKRLTTGSSPG